MLNHCARFPLLSPEFLVPSLTPPAIGLICKDVEASAVESRPALLLAVRPLRICQEDRLTLALKEAYDKGIMHSTIASPNPGI